MKKVSVQCHQVHLAYGPTEVLKGVSLDIAPGEFFALLGPSGSGKSSLLRLIAGFNQHQQGRLLVDGKDISGLPPWKRQIGMVFQNYALWPHMSVWDNVAFGLVERKVSKNTLRNKVEAALDLVGLPHLAQRRPNQLSGGQQQRVALARTIVIEPQVLLLDEPLSNLDKTLRVQMRQELLSLQRRLGLTTIFVTHDQEEAMSTADRMAVLDQGVLQQVGSPMDLYDKPANAFVAGFVGTMNLLPAQVQRAQAGEQAGSEALAVTVAGVVTKAATPARLLLPAAARNGLETEQQALLSFRPHATQLVAAGADAPAPGPSTAGVHWLTATVLGAEFLGGSTRYQLQVGVVHVAADQVHMPGQPRFAEGASVMLGLELAQLRLLPV